ncbi:MAG TPA: hypothetical protein VF760_12465 [Xanthobacteraceae bacterium]
MDRHEAPPLSLDEIKRWCRRFLHDPEFRDNIGTRTVPIAALCRYAGIARQNLYAMQRGEQPLTPNYQRRLSAAIFDVQGGLRFRRVKRKYEIVGPFRRLPRARRVWEPIREAHP